MKDKKDQRLHSAAKKKDIKKPVKEKYIGALILILLFTCLIYLPSLRNGFVWDDDDYIRNNISIRSINLSEIFSNFVLGNYHPLTMLVYSIEYGLWGLNEKGYHIVNLLFHLANVVLVFYVVLSLSEKSRIALIVALLFGIHPLHVESVAWIAELKDLLYAFFFLSSYYFYLKYIKNENRKYFWYSFLLFIFSLLSKGLAVSLPLVLLLTDFFRERKLNYKTIIEKIPFFVLSFVFGIIAVFAQESTVATDIVHFSIPQRIVFACYSFVTYLFKLIIPVDLSAYYSYPVKNGEDVPAQYYFYLALFAAIISGIWYSRRYSKKILFGIIFFVITIFLVLQLLPVGGAIMADRYSYIPSIGIFYLIAEGIYGLWNKKNQSVTIKYGVTTIFFIAVIFYSNRTYSRIGIWKDGLTFWDSVISRYQNIPTAYINHGILLADQRRYDEALSDYDSAIKLSPKIAKIYNNKGIILTVKRKYEDALVNFNKSIELEPTYGFAYNNRGVLLKNMKRYDESLHDYNKAIELQPDYTEAINNRAFVFKLEKKYDEALRDYNKAVELDPKYAKVRNDRGILLADLNRTDEAFDDYNLALKLQPDYPDALNNRGGLFLKLKKYDEAIGDFSRAIDLSPNFAEAYYNRGITEYDTGKKDSGCMDLDYSAKLGFQYAIEEYGKLCK